MFCGISRDLIFFRDFKGFQGISKSLIAFSNLKEFERISVDSHEPTRIL